MDKETNTKEKVIEQQFTLLDDYRLEINRLYRLNERLQMKIKDLEKNKKVL